MLTVILGKSRLEMSNILLEIKEKEILFLKCKESTDLKSSVLWKVGLVGDEMSSFTWKYF